MWEIWDPGWPWPTRGGRAVNTLVRSELFPWPRLSGCYFLIGHLFLVAHGSEVYTALTHQSCSKWKDNCWWPYFAISCWIGLWITQWSVKKSKMTTWWEDCNTVPVRHFSITQLIKDWPNKPQKPKKQKPQNNNNRKQNKTKILNPLTLFKRLRNK